MKRSPRYHGRHGSSKRLPWMIRFVKELCFVVPTRFWCPVICNTQSMSQHHARACCSRQWLAGPAWKCLAEWRPSGYERWGSRERRNTTHPSGEFGRRNHAVRSCVDRSDSKPLFLRNQTMQGTASLLSRLMIGTGTPPDDQ